MKPGFCCIGITDSCMLRCRMCEKWKEDRGTAGIAQPSTEEWKRFIRQLRGLVDEGFEIDFGGGEALMKADTLELVSYAKEQGFRTVIASNGWLIDDAMAGRIVASGLDSIILSLDSLRDDVHDGMRGVPGVARRVHAAIGHLRKRSGSIHIGICAIIMKQSLDGILDLATWVNANRGLMNSILFMAPMQPNNTEVAPAWFRGKHSHFWPDDREKLDGILDELIRRRREGHWIGNSVPQLEAFKRYFHDPLTFVKNRPCNLDRAVHASSIGDIYFCYRHGLLGNIKDGADIGVLWASPEAEKVRESIRSCKDNCHYLLNCFFEGDYPFGEKQ